MGTLVAPRSTAGSRKAEQSKLARRFTRIRPGSVAEEEFIKEHLPLVRSVVGRLAMTLPAHVDMDDLYSSGLVGLLNAVRNYDPQGGSSFEAYARVRIRGAIFDELRRLDWVPRSVHEKARKVQAIMSELEQENGTLPTPEEVAQALNLRVSEYEDLLEEIRPATFVCLDSASGQTDATENSRYESIPDESQHNPVDRAVQHELAAIVANRLKQLPPAQRKVLALYYFEDMRLREIAEAFGVTESRICQIHAQAILTIRAFLEKQGAHAAG